MTIRVSAQVVIGETLVIVCCIFTPHLCCVAVQLPLLVMIVLVAIPHVHFPTIAVPLTCVQTFPMGCPDLLASHSPLLIMIVLTAMPHVHCPTISIPLRCIQTYSMFCLDLPLFGRCVYPLLIGIIDIAIPHVHFSAGAVTLTGIQTFSMDCFDLSSLIGLATQGLACLRTLSMSMWLLCRPFLARPATHALRLTPTVASTIPRKSFRA